MILNSAPPERADSQPKIERGPILDKNGRILAIQNKLYSVDCWLPYVKDRQETSKLLAQILGMDSEKLLNRMNSRTGSMWIKRKISPSESDRIRALKNQGELDGIYLREDYGRNYPQQRLASHILGYVGTDNTGLDGLEYTLNDILAPAPQNRPAQTPVIYGNQVFLTLDVNAQYMTEKLVRTAQEEHDAESVTVLALDALTGDFIAYASSPDFNPNAFQDYSEFERRNRPLSSAYEPGSVQKIFSIASFIELDAITPYDHFFCDGSYHADFLEQPITCLGNHGNVTAREILKYSCNAGAAYASEKVSPENFYRQLSAFGFGSQTGLPMPGESFGLLRAPEQWSLRSKATIAFGQEILVSAVQVITAGTVFANNGLLLKPHIIDKIVSPDGKIIEDYGREPVQRVISPEAAKAVLLMMESATEDGGTAHRLQTEGLRISAKTGTAETIDPDTGLYSDKDFIASCLAIFPTEAPQVIIYAVIEKPRSFSYYGGRIAAPLVKQVMDKLIPHLGIQLSGTPRTEHSGRVTIEPPADPELGETMPDLTGLSKREIMPLMQDRRFRFDIRGEGWVTGQSPDPGAPLTEETTIILELQ